MRQTAHLLLLAASLLLTACFATTEPVLDAAEGDALPGGPGLFRVLDEDGKPQGRLQVSPLRSQGGGQRYRAVSETLADGRRQVEQGELILKHIDGDRYLVQIRESDKKYLLAPAQITPERFTVMAMDAETLARIAERQGLRTVQEPVGGDGAAIEAAIRAGEQLLVLTMEGPQAFAPRDKLRAIALEMAQSEEVAPLPDADYTRQTR